ncbi:MAG: rhodanese-like domain-containing protein [Deltaproteobacteria bacterium]|nr:rhodanese-like domain-containing protein [Deltaproteobacteria bacterium]
MTHDYGILTKIKLIDVRRPEEYNGEYGHIKGSKLMPLGFELENYLKQEDKSTEMVFICRSGGRSGSATGYAQNLGFKSVVNLAGGMIRWTELGFPAEDRQS